MCSDYGLVLVGFGNLAVDAAVTAMAILLITGLFFLGPALATHFGKRPLFAVFIVCFVGRHVCA